MTSRHHAPIHYRRSVAEIDLRRVERNVLAFKGLFPEGTFICPMVKANAYGHGDVEVAKALRHAGVDALGVALIEEGERLRQSGDRDHILVFGPCDLSSAEAMLREDLTAVASDWSQLEALDHAHTVLGADRVVIHFEFNTGMNRLGFEPSDVPKLKSWLAAHTKFRLEGVCTHLYSGNDTGDVKGESNRQLDSFAKIVDAFGDQKNLIVHALNSSGAVNLWKRLQDGKDVAASAKRTLGQRPGIGLYGATPSNDEHANIQLKAVMSLKTHLVSFHRVKAGDDVRMDLRSRLSEIH